MAPQINPKPDQQTELRETKPTQGALKSLVQAEKLMQLAFMIPAATLIGWFGGALLDRAFHQHWIYIVGLLLGAVAGFMQTFRIVLQNMKE
jgi:F0F1-type ATP synthase assembly protein I